MRPIETPGTIHLVNPGLTSGFSRVMAGLPRLLDAGNRFADTVQTHRLITIFRC